MSATRTVVVWCPDWPITAAISAGLAEAGDPVAVFRANRVVAAAAEARREGVRRAMRRREAQSRCSDLVVIDDEPARDARGFEIVAAALEIFTPRIEIVRPGYCQFPTRGPSRYHGGDEALAHAMLTAVREVLRGTGSSPRIGIADGPFAAALAARTTDATDEMAATIIAPETSTSFLAQYPLSAFIAVEGGRAVTRAARSARRPHSRSTSGVDDPDGLALIDHVDLFDRLGIRTMAALTELPLIDVAARFGPVGERMWRLASGLDERAPSTRTPPPDLIVEAEMDPPVERIDTAAFHARALAEELYDRLASHGLACTRVCIEAETEDGRHLSRLWRQESSGRAGGLGASSLADRVRWQLDGWLQRMRVADAANAGDAANAIDGEPIERLTGGITRLRLVPDEVVPDVGRQLGLWGGASAADERAARAFARVQGLLGPDSVCTIALRGGRRPTDRVQLVPWGERCADDVVASRTAPWPGALPGPQPTVVLPFPEAIEVCAADGAAVRVNRRGELHASPCTIRFGNKRESIVAWAGPWPVEERWWDVQQARRQARLQIVTDSGTAHLVVLEAGSWWLDASYA